MYSKLQSKWFRSQTIRLPFYYGWVIVFIAGLAHFVSGPGQTYVASVFMGPILDEFGWSKSLFSSIYTAGSLTAAALMFLSGRITDRFGVRVVLTAVCVLLGGAAVWMTSIRHPVQLYIGIAALRTLGQGAMGLLSTTMVALWFVRIRGRATAIASLGEAVSQAVFPILAFLLISRFGWRNAWFGLALVVWGALLLPTLFLARRNPESVGLLPDGDSVNPARNRQDPAVSAAGGSSAANDRPKEVNFTLNEALRTKTLWLLVVAGMSMPLIMTGLMLHHVPLMELKGIGSGLAAATLSTFGPLMLAGTFVGGLLSDRIKTRYIMVAGQVLFIGTILFTFAISRSWHAFLYMMMAGFSVGVIKTAYAVIWPNYYGRRELGSIRGIASTAMVGFSALGPLPFGLIFDMTGSYDKAILILLSMPVMCGIAALLAIPPRKGGVTAPLTKQIRSTT
jgi:sugar phosphate permease